MLDVALTAGPHLLGALNVLLTALIVGGFVAIRRGNRDMHPRLMKSALAVSVLFLSGYLVQTAVAGHRRFPGDDWVRTTFVVVLTSHTLLAVAIVPLVVRTAWLAAQDRFEEHRRIAKVTFPLWVYVSATGVLIYWMNNFLRPVS